MKGPLVALLFGLLIAGCSGPKPYLLDGDAKHADIGYASDPAATLPIARAHCASFERLPRLLQAQQNVAYYECYKP